MRTVRPEERRHIPRSSAQLQSLLQSLSPHLPNDPAGLGRQLPASVTSCLPASDETVPPQYENWTEAWSDVLRLPQALSRSPNERVSTPPKPRACSQWLSCGPVLPGEAPGTLKEPQIQPPTWQEMSSKPTTAARECPQHLQLCLSVPPSCAWGLSGVAIQSFGCPRSSQPHPVGPSGSRCQRALWELLLASLSWAAFPSTPREGFLRTLW